MFCFVLFVMENVFYYFINVVSTSSKHDKMQ